MSKPEPPDPIERFAAIYTRAAAGYPYDVTAVTLATVDEQGGPSARVVLLKGFDARGFVFYTNRESRKGRELQANPRAALCAYWPHLGEQVRVEGAVELVSDAESDAYFASRPRESQLGAWASQQSAPLDSRELLLAAVHELDVRYRGREVPRPPHWGGYRLCPTRIEFWTSGEFRLHDRIVYIREGNGWRTERLYP
jgi:pyridoxamine 5'-phosphate oxidase